jgi:zinc transport system substrate-binding protein
MRCLTAACLLIFTSALHAQELVVFVSVAPLQYLAEHVGGAVTAVESIVPAGQNPVSYDPTPQQLQRFADAALYVRSGLPFEAAWLERFENLNAGMVVLDARLGLPVAAAARHAHGHRGEELDPHVWTSPLNAIEISRRMQQALTRLSPQHADLFALNQQRLQQRLEMLHEEIARQLQQRAGAHLLVYHPAWGYFAQTYGLQQLAIERDGKEPGPRQLVSLIEEVRREPVACLLVQPQFSGSSARVVAAELGIELVYADPLAYDLPASLLQVAAAVAGGRHE